MCHTSTSAVHFSKVVKRGPGSTTAGGAITAGATAVPSKCLLRAWGGSGTGSASGPVLLNICMGDPDERGACQTGGGQD